MTAPARAFRLRRRRGSPDGRMSLVGHLQELRSRLFKAALSILIVTILVLIFAYHPIETLIQRPYCSLPAQYKFGGTCKLVYSGPLDGFMYRLKICAIAGVVLSCPLWLYQLWAFVTPGLHKNERRYALSFVTASALLFALGSFVSYFILSKSLRVLVSFGGNNLQALLTVDKYLSFVIGMLAVFGLSFEMPLLVVMLNVAGVLSSERLRKWRRGVFFGCFAFAGIATPSQDPFSMLALAVPLCVLYEVSVTVARLHDRAKRRREDHTPFSDLDDDEASPLTYADVP